VPGTGKIMIDSDRVAKHYLPVERSQPFLLPPSVQEFIPEDDLAWFLIDAVAAMDTSAFHAKARLGRAGRAGYDPDMLLTLLIYAYCLGQRSSRRIEALCVRDLGFKVVTGNRVVDHSTIAEFRATHQAAIKNLFTQVLLLCAKAGLRQVGVVAVDGTKIAASAGMGKTRERETLQREYERLCAQVEQMLAEAAAVDASQDALFGADNRGDELPPELRRRMNRLARLRETLRQIDQARAEHDAEEHGQTPTGRPRRADKVATAQGRLDQLIKRRDQRIAKERAAAQDGGRTLPGSRPDFDALIAQAQTELEAAKADPAAGTDPRAEATDVAGRDTPGTDLAGRDTPGTDLAVRDTPGTDLGLRPGCSVDHLPSAARRGNPTDPDSRILKTQRGWIQGYNCQAAVVRVQGGRRLVLAAEVVQDANDTRQAVPMMAAAVANAERAGLGGIDLVALDAGYWSDHNLTAPGPDRLIACGKNRTMIADLRANGYATDEDAPPPQASPADKMRHRLRTRAGAEAYAQRAATVEPAFGDVKHNRGITRFQRRGTPAADSEWKMVNLTSNLRTLHLHRGDQAINSEHGEHPDGTEKRKGRAAGNDA
jgi:transposase